MTKEPLILTVETSGRIGSVAIALGDRMLGETRFSGLMRHSSELFPAISTLLEQHHRKPGQIQHVYISIGPGSFTGLRIAVAMAKTMHLANSTKIVAVDTLDVIAANASDYITEKNARVERIAVLLDAKRSQFFTAAYKLHSNAHDSARFEVHGIHYEKTLTDCLMTAPQLIEKLAGYSEPVWVLGEGLVYHKDKFTADGIRLLPEDYWSPSAKKVHLLGWKKAQQGQFEDPLALQPLYLRRPEPEEKWKEKHSARP